MPPVVAVFLGFVIFAVMLCVQLTQRRYVPVVYWLTVAAVGVFGTMAADVVLGLPYAISALAYAVILGLVFWTWWRVEGTLSVHAITTTRRELFYWAAVVGTFALGTAAGDFAAVDLRDGHPRPHSASRIFAELQNDPAVRFTTPVNGASLESWAKRGVLLLNSSPTVREGTPGSDQRLWEAFTAGVLQVLAQQPKPIVFMLWGDDANRLGDAARLPARHLVLRSTHPRREEASRYPSFSGARHFSRANQFLASKDRSPVDWQL